MYYNERLGRIPKMVVLSSDDEFMQVSIPNPIWIQEEREEGREGWFGCLIRFCVLCCV